MKWFENIFKIKPLFLQAEYISKITAFTWTSLRENFVVTLAQFIFRGPTTNENRYFPNSLRTDLGSDNELNLVARVGPLSWHLKLDQKVCCVTPSAASPNKQACQTGAKQPGGGGQLRSRVWITNCGDACENIACLLRDSFAGTSQRAGLWWSSNIKGVNADKLSHTHKQTHTHLVHGININQTLQQPPSLLSKK